MKSQGFQHVSGATLNRSETHPSPHQHLDSSINNKYQATSCKKQQKKHGPVMWLIHCNLYVPKHPTTFVKRSFADVQSDQTDARNSQRQNLDKTSTKLRHNFDKTLTPDQDFDKTLTTTSVLKSNTKHHATNKA